MIYLRLFLLLLIAVYFRQDMSIQFSSVTLTLIIYCILFIFVSSLDLNYLYKGLGLSGGLYHFIFYIILPHISLVRIVYCY